MLEPLTWSILLMIAGCALAIMEVFIPSGGILGFLASASVLSSIALAFYDSGPRTGLAFALAAVVLMPAAVALAFKYWPKTAMGRRFLLGLPTDEEVLPSEAAVWRLKPLVGKIGTAKTPMLPSGAILIEGRTVDAVSQGMPIEPGQAVKVIEVRAYRVVVRPVDDDERPPLDHTDDVLSQPIDKLGLDPLDDPLA